MKRRVTLQRMVRMLCILGIANVQSFILCPNHVRLLLPPLNFATENVEFTTEEVKAMDDLIISLSMEPTDESRRQRALQLFETELAKPNGAPKRFTDLFDAVLIVVGDRVQMAAKKRALEGGQKAEESEGTNSTKDFMQRSAEERQLWALVDLMVQTKTLVKKARGTLGNNGNFT